MEEVRASGKLEDLGVCEYVDFNFFGQNDFDQISNSKLLILVQFKTRGTWMWRFLV